MTKKERQEQAERLGLPRNIGRKVIPISPCLFRPGDVAEIVGWRIREEDNIPFYLIRFDNGEVDEILGGDYLQRGGHMFV